jgi:hypothetical protein
VPSNTAVRATTPSAIMQRSAAPISKQQLQP